MNIHDMLCWPADNDPLKREDVIYSDSWRVVNELANSYHQQQPQPPPSTSLSLASSPSPAATKTSQATQQPQTVSPSSTLNQPDKPAPQSQQQQKQHKQQSGGAASSPAAAPVGTFQTLRLRDETSVVNQPATTTAPRTSKKRKSPPSTIVNNSHEQQNNSHVPPHAPPPPPGIQHMSGPPPPGAIPPHALMHAGPLPPHLGGPPPPPIHAYQYVPAGDYTPGGMPPPTSGAMQPVQGQPSGQGTLQPDGDQSTAAGRALSQSKRAEQNRKAQRAFRERRDQHVKALESRSQLLDAALASADEANRRWEDCRALVDQLRIENAALRVAINQLQQHQGNGNTVTVAIPLPVQVQPQGGAANGANVPSASASPSADDSNVQADNVSRPVENGDTSKDNLAAS